MKINSINNNINFKGVYLVASKDKQLKALKKELDDANCYYNNFGVSDFNFNNSTYHDKFQKAKQEGKSVDVFVTGAKDCVKIAMNETGWHSVDAITKKAEIFFDLSDDDFYCVSKSLNYDKD